MKSLIPLLLLVLLTYSCKTNQVVTEEPVLEYEEAFAFNFLKNESLANVVDKAAAENKLVFVDIYTDWCMPCKVMDEEVFNDENLGDYFNENFVSFKVNAEKGHGPDIATIYQVQAYPTLLFLDSKGRVLVEKKGMAFHAELRDMAEESLLISGQGNAE